MSDDKRKNSELVEELRVSGEQVVEKVRELIEKGNVRRLIVRRHNDEVIVELPLTPTVIGAGAMLVFAPIFTMLAVVVAYLAEVKIEVVRQVEATDDDRDTGDKKKRIEIE
ncbi:MAG: DUF4342 domain-containing protein [Anaerolineae bacterium]|nr:DUF4342 domain-containing protein [Anaerolineae bacterium]MDW8173954.1 DUF4342 domain-containing protein [Anaerolineae bacterium]